MIRRRFSGVLVLVLALGSCKKEAPLPEHELQLRIKEQARARLRQEREEAAKRQGSRDAGVDPYRTWSPAVQQAFYALYRSRSQGIPEKARALAQHGLAAAGALRAIAAGEAHSAQKRALASFMLVDLHMFRVDDLARLTREHQLVFVQRAAIEALARVGNPQSEALLDALVRDLPTMPLPKMPRGGASGDEHAGHGHGAATDPDADEKLEIPANIPPEQHPMVRWVGQVRQAMKGKRWAYSSEQLLTLDRVQQADGPQKLRLAINAISGSSLESGLRVMLGSPVTRSSVQAGVAFKLVEPYQHNSRELRKLCAAEEHQLIRLQAARMLLERGRPADRAFVTRLADSAEDPIAPLLQRMLKSQQGG